MWLFGSKRKYSDELDIMSVIKDIEDVNIHKLKRTLYSFKEIDIYSNEVTFNDIENFFLKKPEFQSDRVGYKRVFQEIFKKGENHTNQELSQQYALYDLGSYSNQIDIEYFRYLLSIYEIELRNYIINKLQFRYLKSLKKYKKIKRQKRSVSELPLLSCLLEFNDFIENIKKVKQFFTSMIYCFTAALAAPNILENDNKRKNQYLMFSLIN